MFSVFAIYFIFRAIRGERPHEFVGFLVTFTLIVVTATANAYFDPDRILKIVSFISFISIGESSLFMCQGGGGGKFEKFLKTDAKAPKMDFYWTC